MKKPAILSLLLMSVLLTSCFDIVEELKLNKDGSGRYSLTFDLSQLLGNPMLGDLLSNSDAEGLPNLSENMDTLIKFTDIPAEQRSKLDRPAFWDKVSMQILSNKEKEEMRSTLVLDFEDLSDIEYFYKNLDKFNATGGQLSAGEGLGNAGDFLNGGAMFVLNGKKLNRLPVAQKSAFDDPEEAAFAKMFLSNATYTTIYRLPGQVKKVNQSNASINGNTVTFKYPLIDVVNAETLMDCEIKFR